MDKQSNVSTPNKHLADIEEYVGNQKPKVRKNIEIVKANPDYPYMLHGSVNGNIKEFVPRLAERPGPKEDKTVPRVHVSDSVIGCVEGMNELVWHLMYGYSGYGSNEKVDFKNGWYIYKLPFEYCLKPNEELVYDVGWSNEHWLVPYNKETKKYKGEIIAKLIVSEVKYTNIGIDGGKISDVVYEYLLEVMSDKVKIDYYSEPCLPGYYRIRYFPRLDSKTLESKYIPEMCQVERISQSEYNGTKKRIAPDLFANLGFIDKLKKSFSW